jgi:glycosyltransferase involved in cell wall biosynthesis
LKTIILATPNQYGYFTIYYNYAKYLGREYKVICICFDQGENKFEQKDNVNVIYLPLGGGKTSNIIKYYREIYRVYKAEEESIIILKYYFFSSLLNLFIPRKDLILDIRTGYISEFKLKTFFFNSLIRIEALMFKRVIILSESLRERLSLRLKKTYVIPLASESAGYTEKKFDEINLLYVGTLISRNIYQTIEGLSLFVNRKSHDLPIRYYIVGGGKPYDVTKLKQTIHHFDLDGIVHYVGPVYGESLIEYFRKCNIGVSYIPVIKDYDCQPATKTVEYMMSGMPVIATRTLENRKVINDWNGVLIDDNPNSFKDGLLRIISAKDSFDSHRINDLVKEYSFGYVIENKLKPLLFTE